MAEVRREWPGAVELDVTSGGAAMRALAYPALTGRPQVGDRVLLNVTALELGLGTGGYALVVAVPDRLPDGPAGPGHLVKARYTPVPRPSSRAVTFSRTRSPTCGRPVSAG